LRRGGDDHPAQRCDEVGHWESKKLTEDRIYGGYSHQQQASGIALGVYTPLGFVAFLCQSLALLAKVEHPAAASKVKRTINQAFSDPCTVDFLVRVSPTPPDALRAIASIPMEEST